MKAILGLVAVLVPGLLSAPSHLHWSTASLYSRWVLKYAAVPTPPFRTLILRVTDKRTGISHDVRSDLYGERGPLVYVARWPRQQGVYVLAIQQAMPDSITLWELREGKLKDVWEASGNPALEYSPNLLRGSTVLLGRSTAKLHLQKYMHDDRIVYECWTRRGRAMVLERYAVWDEERGYRLLPRHWGPKISKREPFIK